MNIEVNESNIEANSPLWTAWISLAPSREMNPGLTP